MTFTNKKNSWHHIFAYFGPKKWHTFKSNQTFEYLDYSELFKKILSGKFNIRFENEYEKRLLISIALGKLDKEIYIKVKSNQDL